MGVADLKVRVKHTFLELVEDDEPQPQALQARTDPQALRAQLPAIPLGTFTLLGASGFGAEALAAAAGGGAAPQYVAGGGQPAGLGGGQAPEAAVGLVREPSLEAGQACKLLPRDDSAEDLDSARGKGGRTTVMLRNVPNDYTRDMLLELLDASGFAGRYDFVYLPTDFSRRAGLGYAFVNLVSAEDAELVREQLEGFRRWSVPSSKACSVGWSNPCQGFEANVDRYRNSPIMHASVPDEFKPAVFAQGKRAPFPRPTKRVRKPDVQKYGRRSGP